MPTRIARGCLQTGGHLTDFAGCLGEWSHKEGRLQTQGLFSKVKHSRLDLEYIEILFSILDFTFVNLRLHWTSLPLHTTAFAPLITHVRFPFPDSSYPVLQMTSQKER